MISKTSDFPISTDYVDQMRLYGEIELMLTTVINDFLIGQMAAGHMSLSSIQKIARDWHQKSRPQVLDFHFDLPTQFELIKLNTDTFRFHGEEGNNGMKQAVMFNCLRGIVRELSIRTFCAPDSVIKKVMHDCWRVIEMMGAKPESFMLLQHIQGVTLKKIGDMCKQRRDRQKIVYGVTRPFVPPGMEDKNDDDADDNPDDGIWRE